MNPKFLKTLKAKKKRTLDPNIVRPNLFSQAKELRSTKQDVDRVDLDLSLTKQRLDQLEARNRRLESSIEVLQNWIRNRMK
jgi:septal ring factor EnvC (AmiA/AmiB activator)